MVDDVEGFLEDGRGDAVTEGLQELSQEVDELVGRIFDVG